MDIFDPLSLLNPLNLIDDPVGIGTIPRPQRPRERAPLFAATEGPRSQWPPGLHESPVDLLPALRHAVDREMEDAPSGYDGYDDPVVAAEDLFGLGNEAAAGLCEWLGYEPREPRESVELVTIGGAEFEAGSSLAKNARALEALPPPCREQAEEMVYGIDPRGLANVQMEGRQRTVFLWSDPGIDTRWAAWTRESEGRRLFLGRGIVTSLQMDDGQKVEAIRENYKQRTADQIATALGKSLEQILQEHDQRVLAEELEAQPPPYRDPEEPRPPASEVEEINEADAVEGRIY